MLKITIITYFSSILTINDQLLKKLMDFEFIENTPRILQGIKEKKNFLFFVLLINEKKKF